MSNYHTEVPSTVYVQKPLHLPITRELPPEFAPVLELKETGKKETEKKEAPQFRYKEKDLQLTNDFEEKVNRQIQLCNNVDGNPSIWSSKDLERLELYRNSLSNYGQGMGVASQLTYQPAVRYIDRKIFEIKQMIGLIK